MSSATESTVEIPTKIIIRSITTNEVAAFGSLLGYLQNHILLDVDLVIFHILLQLIDEHVEGVHRSVQGPYLVITI